MWPNTQVTLFLSQEVNETESELTRFICVSQKMCLLQSLPCPSHSYEANGTGHHSGRRSAPGRGAAELARVRVCFDGPISLGLNDGTTTTLAGLTAGAEPLFVLPSSATAKAGPGKWQLLS